MLEIRKAYPTDAYSIINIKDMVWKSEFYDFLPNGIIFEMNKNLDKRINHLKNQIIENNRIFVAFDDEVMVGYIFFGKASNVIYDNAAEIRDIYVLPKYQRQGIGTKLFEMAKSEIKKLGYSSLVLFCPWESKGISFFLKLQGEKKDLLTKNVDGYSVIYDLVYFELNNNQIDTSLEWNDIYLVAQEHLGLLNDINRELAVISTETGKMYLGLGIKNKVCPIESALSNMYIGGDKKILKILVLNRESKPVLPCGKCRDLLVGLNQVEAKILFDYGTLQTMSMQELNPYYKNEEKV